MVEVIIRKQKLNDDKYDLITDSTVHFSAKFSLPFLQPIAALSRHLIRTLSLTRLKTRETLEEALELLEMLLRRRRK